MGRGGKGERGRIGNRFAASGKFFSKRKFPEAPRLPAWGWSVGEGLLHSRPLADFYSLACGDIEDG
jgi:hypothetical protein